MIRILGSLAASAAVALMVATIATPWAWAAAVARGAESAPDCADVRAARQILEAAGTPEGREAARQRLVASMRLQPRCVVSHGQLLRARTLEGAELLGNGGNGAVRQLEPIRGNAADSALTGIPRTFVETFIGELFDAWNALALEDYLDERFPDRARLLAELAERPAEARATVVGIGLVQILAERWDGATRHVEVLVRVRGELEQDAAGGREATRQELLVEFSNRVR